jgi:hypothetical protein
MHALHNSDVFPGSTKLTSSVAEPDCLGVDGVGLKAFEVSVLYYINRLADHLQIGHHQSNRILALARGWVGELAEVCNLVSFASAAVYE